MLREHPLRILRFSKKFLWLLIFPILAGVSQILQTSLDLPYGIPSGSFVNIVVRFRASAG